MTKKELQEAKLKLEQIENIDKPDAQFTVPTPDELSVIEEQISLEQTVHNVPSRKYMNLATLRMIVKRAQSVARIMSFLGETVGSGFLIKGVRRHII